MEYNFRMRKAFRTLIGKGDGKSLLDSMSIWNIKLF